MSVAVDPREAALFERRRQLEEINVKREAAGLQPIAIGPVSLNSYVETMFYTERQVPWHVDPQQDKPGAKVSVIDCLTSDEAIEKAGLNWEVGIGQLWGGPKQRLVDDRVAIYRTTDDKVLGVVSPQYQPIQNREAFAFLDSLVQDGTMVYETAGSLYGGKKIWILARLADDWTISVGGREDHHSTYVGIVTSHDGTGVLSSFPTEVRMECRNTTRLALAGADFTARVTHKGDVQGNMARARQLMKVTTGAQRRYQEWMQQLADEQVTEDDVTLVRDSMFGSLDDDTSTRRKHQVERFLDIYNAEADREGANGYALAQAVTGWATHAPSLHRREDGTEGMLSLLGGPLEKYTKSGFTALEKATGIKLASN